MTTPTCPPGTVQVGITTVRYPEGDKTCIICKDCETPQIAECWEGDYFNEAGWAYLAREQTWTYNNATQSCSLVDVEYEPSGQYPFNGNVHVFVRYGTVGTDAIGRIWQVQNAQTVNNNMTGLGCGPASAEWVAMHLVNTDGTIASGSTVVGDPKVIAGSFAFKIETWVFGVVVGYGNTLEEADLNAFAQIPGLS